MTRNHAPEPRNAFGYPVTDTQAEGYLPREARRDTPLPITMEEPTESPPWQLIGLGIAALLFAITGALAFALAASAGYFN